MASKLQNARKAAARARAALKSTREQDTLLAPVAGAVFGQLEKRGVYMPSIPKLGRHFTTGGLLLAVGMNMPARSRIGQVCTQLGRAAATIGGYEMGLKGSTVAGVYDDDEETLDISSD